MLIKHKNALLIIAVVGLLSGCSGEGELADLQAFVADVNAKPKGTIEPLPEFKPYESFQYSAAGLRAPFSKPVDVKLIKYKDEKAKNDVKPDFNRPKEYLEGFSIDALKMVGTISLKENELWALVDDAEGGVHKVQPGNYLGRNHGRITAVDSGQIDVIEIVPDGHGGWLERPRSIKLQDEI
ncbi:MAG: pilus assembly protein PilP [Pseudomonadales bacterium]|nr:pilus assembly protein PilP [Pseudomonadales bacterium]